MVSGGNAPDLAVFYDGYNEILSQFQVGLHTEPSNIQANEFADRLGLGHHGDASSTLSSIYDFWVRHSALERVARVLGRGAAATPAVPIEGDQEHRPQDRGRAAGSIYARGVQIARRLADSYGFRSEFFFQPTIFTKRLVAGEKPLLGASDAKPRPWRRAIDVARTRVGSPVTDLSDALNGVQAPLMYDDVHTNELGAKVMARALYAKLGPQLRKLAARRPA
jgi:hypothetical protein